MSYCELHLALAHQSHQAKKNVRKAKIDLHVCTVSLSAWRGFGPFPTLRARGKHSNLSTQMCRLIPVFNGSTCHIVSFTWPWLTKIIRQKKNVRKAKIDLHECTVSLSAWRGFGPFPTLRAPIKHSNLSTQMCRLIPVFNGSTCHIVSFTWPWLTKIIRQKKMYVKLRLICTYAQSHYLHGEALGPFQPLEHVANTLICLHRCAG